MTDIHRNEEGHGRPRAYSYIRMSTDVQLKGDSLRRQMQASEAFARQHGLELVDTIKDIGVSAFKGRNRSDGALAKFLALLNDGAVAPGSYLIVESLDRMSREAILKALSLFTEILSRQVTIVTLTDNQIYTEESIAANPGQIFLSIGAMLRANEESRTKSIRLSAAWENKRDNISGRKLTALVPAWIRLDRATGKFELLPEKALIVRKIFELSIGGHGSNSICTRFNADRATFPPNDSAKGWHKSYIQKILESRATYGAFQPHKVVDSKRVPVGEIIEDYYPPVISREEFELSRSRVQQRKLTGAGRKGKLFSNLFTRMVICGECAGKVVFRNKGVTPKGGRYLRCGNAERNLKCSAPGWRYEEFETAVLRFVREINLSEVLGGDSAAARRKSIEIMLAGLKAQRQSLEQRVQNLLHEIGSTDPLLAIALRSNASDALQQLERVKIEAELAERELLTIDHEAKDRDMSRTFEDYQTALDRGSPEEILSLRHKLHSRLTQIVSWIMMNNVSDVQPQSVDELDDEFIEILAAKGITGSSSVLAYLKTDAGLKHLRHHWRDIEIVFKSGVMRSVQPSRELSYPVQLGIDDFAKAAG